MATGRQDLVVFTCTYYATLDDVRLKCCLDFLSQAKAAGLRVVVVDASPVEAVRAAMRSAGAHLVTKQQAVGKKGAALREALALARDVGGADDCFLCWQEPEKADMARHWAAVVSAAADVLVPMRNDELFRETYPVEQYHSESYANHYISLVAKAHGFFVPLDWHFGPFAFRSEHAHFWLDHAGELWDAQLVPIISAIHRGLNVVSVPVHFSAPAVMKLEEEGSLVFVEKRLMQINYLAPKMVQAWKVLQTPAA
ncbi:hypothetical protein M885DRAFT_518864 [Pelagophyceae sp. CCMP2097]|nr:hypothetical protein M885DRAFT_518864 [Pelagophyceae sp. CCMP2097]